MPSKVTESESASPISVSKTHNSNTILGISKTNGLHNLSAEEFAHVSERLAQISSTSDVIAAATNGNSTDINSTDTDIKENDKELESPSLNAFTYSSDEAEEDSEELLDNDDKQIIPEDDENYEWTYDDEDRLLRLRKYKRRFSHFKTSQTYFLMKTSVVVPFRVLRRLVRLFRTMVNIPYSWLQSFYYEFFLPNVLLYNLSWEDTRIDRALLEVKDKILITLTSAGDNVLDALCEGAKRIYAVDQNVAQTALMELKIAGIKTLQYRDFYNIFGNADGETFRFYYPTHLRPHLTPASAAFFDSRPHYFDSFFYRGGSGTVAWTLVKVIFPLLGLSTFVQGIKRCTSLQQQKALWKRYRPRAERMVRTLSILGLWKFFAWAAAVPTNQQEQLSSHWDEFMMECLDHLLMNTYLRGENHYYAVYLFGYYPNGNTPRYLKKKWFPILKQRIERIIVKNADLLSVYEQLIAKGEQIDRFNLLDHQDWMTPTAVLREWQLITQVASKNALALWKSASEFSSPAVLAHLPDVEGCHKTIQQFFTVDCTPTYRSIRFVRVPSSTEQLFRPRANPADKRSAPTWSSDAQVLYHMYVTPVARKVGGIMEKIGLGAVKSAAQSAIRVITAVNNESNENAKTNDVTIASKKSTTNGTATSAVSVSSTSTGPSASRSAMNTFYSGQASFYDSFRDRMLHGRPLLMAYLPALSGGVWCDVGGGTASNLEFFSNELISNFKQIYIVDVCDALLQQAAKRVAMNGWADKVSLIQRDCCLEPILYPSEQPSVDLITFSYSLTMIPNWEQAIENAYQLLKPGGFIGVCDFTVLEQQNTISKLFWTNLFSVDGVHLRLAHRQKLRSLFDVCVDEIGHGGFAYVPMLKCPYYVFLGRKPLEGQKPTHAVASYSLLKKQIVNNTK